MGTCAQTSNEALKVHDILKVSSLEKPNFPEKTFQTHINHINKDMFSHIFFKYTPVCLEVRVAFLHLFATLPDLDRFHDNVQLLGSTKKWVAITDDTMILTKRFREYGTNTRLLIVLRFLGQELFISTGEHISPTLVSINMLMNRNSSTVHQDSHKTWDKMICCEALVTLVAAHGWNVFTFRSSPISQGAT